MTLDVYRGRKTTLQQQRQSRQEVKILQTILNSCVLGATLTYLLFMYLLLLCFLTNSIQVKST